MVIVSPHLDDAVLGCSYLLAAHPGVPVVTVFAGRPVEYPDPPGHWDALGGFGPGDEVHVTRRAEDAAALGGFDAQPVWLDFVEHSYLERAEWVRPDDVVDTLEATLRGCDPTAVFAPFGLGNPDHACTHDAAMLVRERMLADPDGGPAWFCYEDTGYNHIPGTARLADLEAVPQADVADAVRAARRRRSSAQARGDCLLPDAGRGARGGVGDVGQGSTPQPRSSTGGSRRHRPGGRRLTELWQAPVTA